MGGDTSKELRRMADVRQGFSPLEAKQVFDMYDTKKKGSLNREEGMKFLEHYIRAKTLKVSAAELFRALDADGDGNIQYSKLVRRATAFVSEDVGPLWDAVVLVRVRAARGLVNRRTLRSPDPLCIVRCGMEERQTSVVKSTVSPGWNDQPFPMKPFDKDDVIHFDVVSFHKGKDKVSHLGHCSIEIKSLLVLPAGPQPLELKLAVAAKGDKPVSGSLEVQVEWGTPGPAPVPLDGNGFIYHPRPGYGNPSIRAFAFQFDLEKGAMYLNTTEIFFRDLIRVIMPGSHKLCFEVQQDRRHRVYCAENPGAVAFLTDLRMRLQTLGFGYPRPLPFQLEVPARALTQLPMPQCSNPVTADWDKIVKVFGAQYFLPRLLQQMNIGDNAIRFSDPQFLQDEAACIGLLRALRYNTFFQTLILHRAQPSAPISSLLGSVLQNGYWHTLSLRGLKPEFGAAFHFSMFNRYTPPSLTHLDVAGNNLGNAGVAGILAGLQATPFLRFLNLSNNDCTNFDGLRMLPGIALNYIDLSNNVIQGPSVLPLVDLLARTSYLQQLRVAGSGVDMNPLLNICARLPYLHSLDISFGDFTHARDSLLLLVRSPTLVSLTARGCPMLGDILFGATFRLPSRLSIDVAGGQAPPMPFLVNPMPVTVRELNLSGLGLGRGGVAYVASSLASFPHGIEVLHLSNNVSALKPGENFSISIAELSHLVQVASPLRELHLAAAGGGYGPELAPFLGALASCRLSRLNLAGNSFGDTGLQALGSALRKNRTLTSIHIDDVKGTFQGYQALRGCLYGNQKILDISIPQMDVQSQMKLQQDQLQSCIQAERVARGAVKRACKPPKNSRNKAIALGELRIAKRGQAAANRSIQKLQKLIKEIDAGRARNEAAFQARRAAATAKQQMKVEQKQSKAIKKFEKAKLKKAQKLIDACIAIMPALKSVDKEIFRDMKAIVRQKPHTEVTVYQLVQCLSLNQELQRVSGNLYPQMCSFVAETRVDLRIAEAQQRRVHQMTQSGAPVDERNKKYKDKYYDRNRYDSSYNDPYYYSYYYYNPYDSYYCFDGYGYDHGYGCDGWHTHAEDVCPLSDVHAYEGPDLGESKDDLGEKDAADASAGDQEGKDDGKQDIVDMYAAAGPHDLPDEGPTGGGASSALMVEVVPEHKELYRKARDKNRALLNQLQQSWENIVASTLAKAFPTPVVVSRKELRYCESRRARQNSSVTVVTQCSLDRLHCLYAQAIAWDGCLSACIYIPSTIQDNLLSLDRALADVRAVHAQVEKKAKGILDIALLYQDEADTQSLYPINLLRNVAIEQARTAQIFVLDVDFIPARGLCAHLEKQTVGTKQALVIPAFELMRPDFQCNVAESTDDESEADEESTYEHQDRRVLFHLPSQLPQEKAEMCNLLQAKKAEPFHVKAFPQGHSSTNSERWATEKQPYEVEYEEGYEPYVVVNKKDVPNFDERFLGYGMNKIQWLYHLNALNFKFCVEPTHFVVAAAHMRSSSWKAAYGSRPSEPFHHIQIKMLYNTFKTEMKRQVSDAPA